MSRFMQFLNFFGIMVMSALSGYGCFFWYLLNGWHFQVAMMAGMMASAVLSMFLTSLYIYATRTTKQEKKK